MKFSTRQLVSASAFLAAASLSFSTYAQTSVFADGEGLDTKWENPANWFDSENGINDVLPTNVSTVTIKGGLTIDFDADTSVAYTGDPLGQVVIDRIGIATPPTPSDGTLNVSGGSLNFTRSGAGIVAAVGRGADGVVNLTGGTLQFGHRMLIGSAFEGNGTVNVDGGDLIVYRGGNTALLSIDDQLLFGRPSLELGVNDGDNTAIDENGNFLPNDSSGTMNLSSGSLETRAGLVMGPYGTFHVEGSDTSSIGIGSNQNGDGYWVQQAGSVLRTGLDASGVTPIFVDETDGIIGSGGGDGDVKFYAGSILDPYDTGDAIKNTWVTVMEWEGTALLDDIALSSDAVTAGWEMQFLANELQVRLPGIVVDVSGDYNDSGSVEQGDLDLVLNNWGSDTLGNIPAGWVNDLPVGNVDQAELDLVLNNWGSSTAPSFNGVAVPEPASLALLGGLAIAGLRRRA